MRELYEKGKAAFQRKNFDYALAILTQVLQNEPGLFEAREMLRATQFSKHGSSSGLFKKILGTASSSPQIAKAQLALRSNPVEALNTCEQILNGDPNNLTAHKILAEAALALGFVKTAVLSLEIVFKQSPKDQDNAMRLAEALGEGGNITRAEQIYTELQRANPHDTTINQLLKNLAAKRTMHEGGYNAVESNQGSYRDLLRNKEEAVSLEQENRQVKSDDVAGRLIAEYEQRLAAEPHNLRLLKSIADLYVQKKEFDQALSYYQRIIDSGAVDSSIEKIISDTRAKQIDYQISQLDPTNPEYTLQAAELLKQKEDYLLEEAKKRVDRYPNDLQFRFDLGERYFQAGRIGEAIQEFQKAQNNPHRKIQCLSYLGQCFARRNMNDLAARTLQNAIKEKLVLDEEKKELVYTLGQVLEKMGKKEEAIEQFKQIYEVDIGYKDVSQRVDAYYAQQG